MCIEAETAVYLQDGRRLSKVVVYRDGDDACYIVLKKRTIYVGKYDGDWREIGDTIMENVQC